jgi:hypothetical protein
LQSLAWKANLATVQRSAFVVLFLASLPGCATGELMIPGRTADPSQSVRETTPFLAAMTGMTSANRVSSGLREAASPRVEGAAYFGLAASTDKEAAAEARIATILATDARCPAEMALVDDRVCIDRWEASLVERIPGGAERAWSPFVSIDGHEATIRAVSRPGVIPQAYISGRQGQLACNASGKRLCAADEWEHACRGPQNFQFPYGNERRAGACNDDIRSVHPVAEVAQLLGLSRDRMWREGMNQTLINQLPDTLLPTGQRAECTNAYGVFDMVGNLHEWVDDPDGTFRGGYYMDTTKNGDGCSYQTTAHDFKYHDYSTGFRCCMDPESVE